MPTPVSTETYLHDAEAQARLRAIGASHSKQHSTGGRFVYWIGRNKTWATLERRNGALVLSFWGAKCPC